MKREPNPTGLWDYGRNHIVRWDALRGAQVVFQSHGIANWLSAGEWGRRPTVVAVEKNAILVMEDWGLPTFAAELIGNPQISRVAADGKVTTVVAIANGTMRLLAAAMLLVLGMILSAWRRRRWRA